MDVIPDTNAGSAVAEGIPQAVAIFSQAGGIAILVIVPGEFRLDIAQSKRHREYEDWLEELTAGRRTLDIHRHYSVDLCGYSRRTEESRIACSIQ